MVRYPELKPTTAMKRVIEGQECHSPSALLRRLQDKWKRRGSGFLAAARERAAPKAGAGGFPLTRLAVSHALELGNPYMTATRRLQEKMERMQRWQDLIEPPYMRVLRQSMEFEQRMRYSLGPLYMRALRSFPYIYGS
ncbi:MAG: hypothetical protein ACRED5_02320 [Propylenella sp.]